MRVALLPFLALLAPSLAPATVLHVPGDYRTLDLAVNRAAPGDEIIVAPGTYTGHVRLQYRGPLYIHSSDGAAVTTIDAAGAGPVFAMNHCHDINIEGFTLTGGYSSMGGGVAVNLSTNIRIAENIVTQNSSGSDGGGMWLVRSSVLVEDNEISGNTSNFFGTYDGGGIFHYVTSGVIQRNVVHDNTGHEGGGIIINQSTSPLLEVAYNTFYHNTATLFGGGAYVNVGTSPYIHNNTFFENYAVVNGGGGIWYNAPSSPTIANNIVVNCTGSGIYAYAAGATPTFSCNDVWGNTGGDYAGFVTDQTGTNGNISSDPLFCAPQSAVFTLASASPCAPANSGSCGLIGALDVGCSAGTAAPTRASETTWGAIKDLYRR